MMRSLMAALATFAVLATGACSADSRQSVVVYTSVDQPFSEVILRQFEDETGIEVLAVYDTEAAKTTGLVSRLVAERDRPGADVFWSSEIAQTLWLADEDIFAGYTSAAAADIPAEFKDAGGLWTGVGYRVRILLVNTDLVARGDFPDSIFDLVSGAIPGAEAAIANPLFGTTATHLAALFSSLGADQARAFLQGLADTGVRVVDGNSVVRDMVARGEVGVGITDTDDALIAVEAGDPVEIVFPDQDGLGALLIPNTLALVAGGPNPDNGRALIDFLVSRTVEDRLIAAGFFTGSLREIGSETITAMQVSWLQVALYSEQAKEEAQSILLR